MAKASLVQDGCVEEGVPGIGAIVGSSVSHADVASRCDLRSRQVETPYGVATLHELLAMRHDQTGTFLFFRHGAMRSEMAHQVNYRAAIWALHHVGCQALLVTSSVGVLTPRVPLFRALLVDDLLWPENRLPDGSLCTFYETPAVVQAHLVLSEGVFSHALRVQLTQWFEALTPQDRLVFAYAPGPRTKTAAENRYWAALGASVNSMSLAPEVVLANELGIPTVAVVVGHKYSLSASGKEETLASETAVAQSLRDAKAALWRVVERFLREAQPVPFANILYDLRQHGHG